MKSSLVILVSFVGCVCGCAAVTQQQRERWSETVPICFNDSDCETKWAAARDWVQNNAAYKIQIYSNDLIETYNPIDEGSPRIAARVTKSPLATGKDGTKTFAINANIYCRNPFGCVPSVDESIMSFNSFVSAARSNDARCYATVLSSEKPRMGYFYAPYKSNKVVVKTVCSGSPADQGGLRPNDIITKVDGALISTDKDLQTAAGSMQFGANASIEVQRDGVPVQLNIKLPTKDEATRLLAESGLHKTTQTESSKEQSTEDKVEALGRLKQKGLITEEEFNAKKKQLLDTM